MVRLSVSDFEPIHSKCPENTHMCRVQIKRENLEHDHSISIFARSLTSFSPIIVSPEPLWLRIRCRRWLRPNSTGTWLMGQALLICLSDYLSRVLVNGCGSLWHVIINKVAPDINMFRPLVMHLIFGQMSCALISLSLSKPLTQIVSWMLHWYHILCFGGQQGDYWLFLCFQLMVQPGNWTHGLSKSMILC